MKRSGKVYLAGAGPGDAGLLTVRARDLIERCEILIYDNLVSERIVDLAPPSCERIYVGKSGSSHAMEQVDINNLIVDRAMAGHMVVRLKGGDPFIFGRGGEEALRCAEAGVEFEIVSGVSSAHAVPACAGIPVTHRGLSSSVAFVTGHEDPTKNESDIRWEHLARGVQTLVFLMGVKNLPLICAKLIENGCAPATPAAVIENGCGPKQRTVTGTIDNIATLVSEADIRPPSIIVVGQVVSLRDRIPWFETRPLFGKTIVVTRAREQASALTAKLIELGADVIETPSILIAPLDDASSIHESARNMTRYDWVIFTSVNGVTRFFASLMEIGLDARALFPCRVGAIGSATADELRSRGIIPDLVPETFTGAEMARALEAMNEIRGKSFLLLRADIAPRDLADAILLGGARLVDDVAAYRTLGADEPGDAGAARRISRDRIDLVTFTSSSTAENFARILRSSGGPSPGSLICAAIGPVTAERARQLGFNVQVTAREHTIEGLVESIIVHFSG